MNPMRKVLRGETRGNSASFHNQTVDLVRSSRSRQPVNQLAPTLDLPMAGLVLVRNISGAAVARFSALVIGEPVFGPEKPDEFENRPCFDVDQPASTTAEPAGLVAAVLQAPAADGKIVRAMLQGVTLATVLVLDETHRFADIGLVGGPVDALTSHTSGQAEILWAEPGTGSKWAFIRLGRRP